MHGFVPCLFTLDFDISRNGISTVKQWTASDHKQLERVFLGAIVSVVADPHISQAASSLIDFIYLAQYRSHTDMTLAALQAALVEFHHKKEVFIERGCREHFNIPKLHSLMHYTNTIKNLGSLDGLNTETSERLHIDFAKKAYAATSRKDYMMQMAKWLQRQEAVIWFCGFLNWRHRMGFTDSEGSLSSDSEAQPRSSNPRPVAPYRISQQPHFPKKTIQYLEQYHGALGFLDALKAFIASLPRGHQYFEPTMHDHFDIFSNLVLSMPLLEHAAHKDARIRSHPQRSNGVCKPPTPARFDTVLVEVDPELRRHGGLHGKTYFSPTRLPNVIAGLCVAEVRAIFRLPLHIGRYPQPLAYIHWFKPLQTYDENVKMFRVSRSTRQRRPNAEIIPINRIVQHVHLIPRFPRGAVHPQWVHGHALANAQHFYLNKYIDFHTFEQHRLHT